MNKYCPHCGSFIEENDLIDEEFKLNFKNFIDEFNLNLSKEFFVKQINEMKLEDISLSIY